MNVNKLIIDLREMAWPFELYTQEILAEDTRGVVFEIIEVNTHNQEIRLFIKEKHYEKPNKPA